MCIRDRVSTGCMWEFAVPGINCPIFGEPAGSDLKSVSELSIFPNPATDEVFVNLSEYAGETGTITIYNNLGKVVTSKKVDEITTSLVNIQVPENNFGVHIVSIKIGNKKIISKKLMIDLE